MTRHAVNTSANGSVYFPGTSWQLVDSMLKNNRWNLSTSTAVTFSFPNLITQYPADLATYATGTNLVGGTVSHFEQATAALQDTARSVLRNQFAAVSSVVFLERPAATAQNYYTSAADNQQGGVDISIGMADLTSGGYALQPGSLTRAGDVWFDSWTDAGARSTRFDVITLGDNDYRVVMHEIGHALGLRHPHEGNVGSDLAPTLVLPSNRDFMDYSLMSYRMYEGHTGFTDANYTSGVETFGFAQSLMMLDIQALQWMYGANFTTAEIGNTAYTFSSTTGEMFINGVGQGVPGANRIYRTVWDGGGVDTYDLSNYSTNLAIDLSPGGHSIFSTAQLAIVNTATGLTATGNLFNALQFQGDSRSLIENATGGSGNDTITGNAANNVLSGNAGNDTLDGGAGVDKLLGGAGNDTIFYDAADDLANVLGGADTDTLVFTSGAAPVSFNLVAHQFELAEGRITDTGANAWASYVDHYDSAWRKDYQTGLMDDGRTYYEDYDQLGNQTWSRITYFNDALGRSDVESGQLDTGASYNSDLDNGNLYSWTRLDYWFDSLGRADTESGQLDDGRHYNSDIDNGNLYSWTRIDYWSDSLGRADVETGFLDDGRTYNSDLDNGNQFAWSRIDNWADSLGRLDYQNGAYDATDATHPGWTWQIDYDQANQFAWARVERFYNAAGVIQSETFF
jgi:Ca2+-binding RTX toxin-like protein